MVLGLIIFNKRAWQTVSQAAGLDDIILLMIVLLMVVKIGISLAIY